MTDKCLSVSGDHGVPRAKSCGGDLTLEEQKKHYERWSGSGSTATTLPPTTLTKHHHHPHHHHRHHQQQHNKNTTTQHSLNSTTPTPTASTEQKQCVVCFIYWPWYYSIPDAFVWCMTTCILNVAVLTHLAQLRVCTQHPQQYVHNKYRYTSTVTVPRYVLLQ